MKMSYKYDVFLSYRNIDEIKLWLEDIFLPKLKSYLHLELGHEPAIYYSPEAIKTGDEWRENLKKGLVYSKCLIPIWAPPYFSSEWCTSECNIFLHREKKLGFRTIENVKGLVLPVVVFDGDKFPDFAKDIQCAKFQDYFYYGKGFRDSYQFFEFDQKFRQWVQEDVAPVIENSPKWDKKWLQKTWLDKHIVSSAKTTKVKTPPPTL